MRCSDPGDPAGDEDSRTWCLKNSLRTLRTINLTYCASFAFSLLSRVVSCFAFDKPTGISNGKEEDQARPQAHRAHCWPSCVIALSKLGARGA